MRLLLASVGQIFRMRRKERDKDNRTTTRPDPAGSATRSKDRGVLEAPGKNLYYWIVVQFESKTRFHITRQNVEDETTAGKSTHRKNIPQENHSTGKSFHKTIIPQENHCRGKSAHRKIIPQEKHPTGKSPHRKLSHREIIPLFCNQLSTWNETQN